MAWRLRIRHVTGFTYEGQAHASYNEARLTPMTLPRTDTQGSAVIEELGAWQRALRARFPIPQAGR